MIVTESELRELWQNGRQPLPTFPVGAGFSPAARDFIKEHGLTLQFADPPPSAPSALNVPARLQASLEALHALAALVAAQARHFRLTALAAQLEALVGELTSPHTRPLPLHSPSPLLPRANPPPFAHDHLILHWLRRLRAEIAAVAVLAREQGEAHNPLAARLDALGPALLDLECRFLTGELAWPVGP